MDVYASKKGTDTMIKKINAVVVGKWTKGIIFKRPMLSINFIDGDMEPKYYDLPAKMAFWNAVKTGDNIVLTMELKEEDGRWYPI